MGKFSRNWALGIFAIFGVPGLFSLFIFIAYTLALQQRTLPFSGDRVWLWPAAFLISLAAGNAALLNTSMKGVGVKVVVSVLYLAVMGTTLLSCALLTACALGDCL